MEYSQDQFFALMEAVEEAGGQHLEDVRCASRLYKWSGNQIKPARLPGCGNQTVFAIPYTADDKAVATVHEIIVCARCDDVGMWPRFYDQVMSQ